MNQMSYRKLIPLLLPLVLAACEDRQQPDGTLPSLEGPITDPAPQGTPTPPATSPSSQ